MKKIVSLLLAFLLLFALGCKKEPEPTTFVEDGITQSTLSYIEDAYFEDGVIYVTHVSSIGELIHDNKYPYVEKLVDGRWIQWSLFKEPVSTLRGSSQMPIAYEIDCDPVGAAGQYRLSWGAREQKAGKDAVTYYEYDPNTTYLVCYVTIPEEGEYTSTLPPTPTMEATFVEAEEGMSLQLTIRNNTDHPLDTKPNWWKVQYYTEDAGYDLALPVVHCEFPDDLELLSGESHTCVLPMQKKSGDAVKTMKQGSYRVECLVNWYDTEIFIYGYFEW